MSSKRDTIREHVRATLNMLNGPTDLEDRIDVIAAHLDVRDVPVQRTVMEPRVVVVDEDGEIREGMSCARLIASLMATKGGDGDKIRWRPWPWTPPVYE